MTKHCSPTSGEPLLSQSRKLTFASYQKDLGLRKDAGEEMMPLARLRLELARGIDGGVDLPADAVLGQCQRLSDGLEGSVPHDQHVDVAAPALGAPGQRTEDEGDLDLRPADRYIPVAILMLARYTFSGFPAGGCNHGEQRIHHGGQANPRPRASR